MQYNRCQFSRVTAASCAVLMLLAMHISPAPALAAEDTVIITHAGVTEDKITLATLRATYSMRVRLWPDGIAVHVFVLPDRDPLHTTFARQVLRVYPYVLRDTWDRIVFTGTGQRPTEVASQQEMLQRVATTPGAIGYIEEGRVSDERIKILQIQ